jgi:hypothetical protein
MHWKAGAEVDAALQRFSASGQGTLRRVELDGTRELRLYAAPFFAWISVTPEAVIVWRVMRYA